MPPGFGKGDKKEMKEGLNSQLLGGYEGGRWKARPSCGFKAEC